MRAQCVGDDRVSAREAGQELRFFERAVCAHYHRIVSKGLGTPFQHLSDRTQASITV